MFCVTGDIVNYSHIGRSSHFKDVFIHLANISVNTYFGAIDFFNWEIFLCKLRYVCFLVTEHMYVYIL